jgi:hypothetical protein
MVATISGSQTRREKKQQIKSKQATTQQVNHIFVSFKTMKNTTIDD